MKKMSGVFFTAMFFFFCANSQKVNLSLKLLKGQTYYQTMTSNSQANNLVGGKEQKINTTISGTTSYKVIDIRNGIYDMEVRYENMAMKLGSGDKEIIFSPDKKDVNDIFSSIMSAMLNKPFLIKMSEKGKVLEVKNMDIIFSEVLDKFSGITGMQREQVKNWLVSGYGEKTFRGNFEMLTALYPSENVGKGDKWTIETELQAALNSKIKTTYELMAVNENDFEIHGYSKIMNIDNQAHSLLNSLPIKHDVDGSMTTEIKINKTTGWILEEKMTQNIKDNAEMTSSSGKTVAIPMVMVNEMQLTGH